MHEILINTHKDKNIDLLKARDYYFDHAKDVEKIRNLLLNLPMILLVVSYGMRFACRLYDGSHNTSMSTVIDGWLSTYYDIIIALITILLFFVKIAFDKYIDKKKEISNMIREEYDLNILSLKRNIFAYEDYKEIDKYLPQARYVKDKNKYEAWYSEVFCEDNERNTLCCQMDNVIYTCHLYKDIFVLRCITLSALVFFMILLMILMQGIIHPFLVFFAFFELLSNQWEEIMVCKSITEENRKLVNIVKTQKDLILEDLPANLRILQDCIIYNRDHSLSSPKFLRDKYLKEGNPFYVELDEIKAMYLYESASIPESADELEILSSDDTTTSKISELQERLFTMLLDVKQVFEQNHITFTLDGGTLIGAVRKHVSGVDATTELDFENGKFLFWDDDIDIAIPHTQAKDAKTILKKMLGNKYEIQDCTEDDHYSPRLSTFRIREKNDCSIVSEKDSVLYEKYKYRGIFLDVYTYSPILYNRPLDAIYRFSMIHLLNLRILNVENDCKHGKNPEKSLVKFKKLKATYLKRVNWYTKHAKCDAYYAYVPLYVESRKKAGPYISKEDLYGTPMTAKFEGIDFSVPSNPAKVLEAYYGEKWFKSPFSAKADLIKHMDKKKDKGWFSKATYMTSVYKHLKKLDLFS